MPSFSTRLLARLLDALVHTVVGVVLSALTGVAVVLIAATVPTRPTGTGSTPYDPDLTGVVGLSALVVGLAVVAMVGFGYLYEVELTLRSGATLGKRATGIRVTALGATPAPTRGVLARRYLVQGPLGVAVPFLWLVDGLWQLWDGPRRQCLHDKAARTVVVAAVAPSWR